MELRHRSTFQKKNISTRGALWGPCYKHDGDDCESDSKDPLGWLLSSFLPYKIAQTFGSLANPESYLRKFGRGPVAQSVKRASFKGPGSRCNSTDVGSKYPMAKELGNIVEKILATPSVW